MAIPQTSEPVYIVYRDIPAGEPFDPTSPLLFFPPKGSDELFDALRVAFPHVKTHSERMRDAIIKYLLEERQDEQLLPEPSPATTMNDIPATTVADMPASWPTFASESSFSSESPSMFNSPMTRQTSMAGSSTGHSPPSLDQMTGVFSLSTSSQPKQRVRRKMTEAEKVEYRKRRIVKACSKCAARKRKCPHNQAQMETVPTASKSTARVSKSTSPKSSNSAKSTPPAPQQQEAFDASMLAVDNLDFSEFGNAFIPIQDFTMFEDPLAEFNMDNFAFDNFTHGNDFFTPDVSPLQQTWSFDGQTGDSTLLSSLPDSMSFDQHPQTGSQQAAHSQFDTQQFAADRNNLQSWESQSTQDGLHLRADNANSGNESLLRQRLQVDSHEKPVSTHTAHVHDAESGGLSALNDHAGRAHASALQVSLPQTVLRLTGTKKALRAFSRLSPSTNISMSIDRIADAVRSNSLFVQATPEPCLVQRVPRDARLLPDSQLVDGQSLHDPRRSAVNLPDTSRLEVIPGGVRVRPELRLTSTSVSASQRSAALEGRPASSTLPADELSHTTAGDCRAKSSSSRREQGQASLRRRRPEPSLGEGIPENANPSYELYMARKRIASGLTTLVGANMNAHLARDLGDSRAASRAPPPTGNDNGGAHLQQRVDVAQSAIISNTGSLSALRFEGPSVEDIPPGAVRNCSNARDGTHDDRMSASSGSSMPGLSAARKSSRVPDGIHNDGISSSSGPAAGRRPSREADGIHDGSLRTHNLATTPSFRPGFNNKRDTNRHRDHHGRLYIARVFFGFMLALFFAAFAPSSWVMLTLAILSASTSMQEKEVQCSTKNSWWLSLMNLDSMFKKTTRGGKWLNESYTRTSVAWLIENGRPCWV